ncbi:MAG: glycosyl hydrolase family 5 [Rariglobus sp.]
MLCVRFLGFLILFSTVFFSCIHAEEGEEASGTPAFPTAVIDANADWAPYNHVLEVEAGGVFDQSAFIDAPAGKYGRIVVSPQGHFVFADQPQRRGRFWGVNLVGTSNFVTHAEADQLAVRLTRAGYNAVRFHHYDQLIGKKDGASHDLDPEQLDRIEYLFAALKKQGIYITIDLYTARTFPVSEVPDLGQPVKGTIKQLMPVSENAFVGWSKFAENLLTHRNPHTGLTWAEDPALISICMLNEDSFFFGGLAKRKPELMALYDKAYADWCARQKSPVPTEGPAAAEAFNRFLIEIKQASDAKMTAFLHGIGVRTLLTSDNNMNTEAQVHVRDRFDFVDNHEYWNHPRFLGPSWSLPIAVNHRSSILASLWLPRELMPARIFGKPYTVTEFNFVWPNAARAEGGVLMPAYAGLQDWDALYNFDYAARASDALTPSVVSSGGRVFSLATDPIGMLADRASAFIFLHGDVKPAKGAVAYISNPASAFTGEKGSPHKLPGDFSWLGLLTRIGSVPAGANKDLSDLAKRTDIWAFVTKETPSSALKPGRPVHALQEGLEKKLSATGVVPARNERDVFRSETGQMEVSRSAGTARLVTDYVECFVLPPDAKAAGARVEVRNGKTFGAVYVTSADGKPLAESARVLVLHLTDSLNTGTKFTDTKRNRLEEFGTLPHLVKRGDATITLKLAAASSDTWQAWAVDASGKRLWRAMLKREGDVLVLPAQTVSPEGVTLAYELVRK